MRLRIQFAATLLIIFFLCKLGMRAKGDDRSEPYNYFREWHLLIRKRILKLRETYGGSSRSPGRIEIKIAREQNRRVPRKQATMRAGFVPT
jgi:hypothetical protein